MIHIDKSTVPIPHVLTTLGQIQRQIDENAYNANPSDYQASSPNEPTEKISFDSNIYGAPSVKDSLITIQHGKCCFCESKMRHVSDGGVEHFRPKGRWKQVNGTPTNYPGYYWKAYDWDNLYLACQRCNEREKLDLFPLQVGSPRATNHTIDIAHEKPTFIDPGNEDPEVHIYFFGPYISHYDERGKVTIEELGLQRSDLQERREEKLDDLLAIEDCYISSLGLPNESKTRTHFYKRLRHYTSGLGEYSNMMKCNFSKYLDEL
jgi:uncharacterized protein (TIGR02646 family)